MALRKPCLFFHFAKGQLCSEISQTVFLIQPGKSMCHIILTTLSRAGLFLSLQLSPTRTHRGAFPSVQPQKIQLQVNLSKQQWGILETEQGFHPTQVKMRLINIYPEGEEKNTEWPGRSLRETGPSNLEEVISFDREARAFTATGFWANWKGNFLHFCLRSK